MTVLSCLLEPTEGHSALLNDFHRGPLLASVLRRVCTQIGDVEWAEILEDLLAGLAKPCALGQADFTSVSEALHHGFGLPGAASHFCPSLSVCFSSLLLEGPSLFSGQLKSFSSLKPYSKEHALGAVWGGGAGWLSRWNM